MEQVSDTHTAGWPDGALLTGGQNAAGSEPGPWMTSKGSWPDLPTRAASTVSSTNSPALHSRRTSCIPVPLPTATHADDWGVPTWSDREFHVNDTRNVSESPDTALGGTHPTL